MKILGFNISRAETRAGAEDPRVPISATNFLEYFGVSAGNVPVVTIENALKVPAVTAAVSFLSRSLAALPLHAYKDSSDGAKRIDGKLGVLVHENPNPEMDRFRCWRYFWQQVFTGGRGLAWIERNGTNPEALWPMDPTKVTIARRNGRLFYEFEGKSYNSADVIDVCFMPKADMVGHYGPIALAEKAIQLALSMNDYASGFFAGGGVPPLALIGPMPAGKEAMQRAMNDVNRAIDAAKSSAKPLFPMPPGHELKPIGFDPEKGQMTDARSFQVIEIARAYQIPPVFLQDLSTGSYTNTEQQDLFLVKHLIGQWAQALEGELNLKLFGRENNRRYVEHNLDGLMRGDFVSRMAGMASAIQNGVLTPNEARALDNRAGKPGGDDLLIQGATVPLGTQPNAGGTAEPVPAEPDPQARAFAAMGESFRVMAEAQRMEASKPPVAVTIRNDVENLRLDPSSIPAPIVNVAPPEVRVEPPVVNVAPPVVNYTPPVEKKARRTRTKVLKHDSKGRIKEFEQEDVTDGD